MENENPYSVPESNLNVPSSGGFEVHAPQARATGRGSGWLGEGFSYFKSHAGTWILICIVGFVIMMALNLVPILNIFAGILAPVWSAGLMIGCKAIHDGQDLKVGHLFAGFSNNFGSLIGVGVIVFLVGLLIGFAVLGSTYMSMLGVGGTPEETVVQLGFQTIALKILIILAVMLPVYMAIWFAPALIVLGNKSVIESLKLSFKGCLLNVMPFLIYGILGLLLIIAGSIPLMLGLLVVVPMLIASVFISYKEIFVD